MRPLFSHLRVASGLAALILCGLVLCGLAVLPAAAQPTQEATRPTSPVDLNLVAFTGAISPQGSFRLRVRVSNRSSRALEGLQVVAVFHRRAFHRLDFARAVDAGRVGEQLTTISADLSSLPGRRVQTIELRRSADELGLGSEDLQGVYPLVVRVVRDDETLTTVRTAVVVVSGEVAQPLRAALIAPLNATPALSAGGVETDGLRQDLAPSGRLRTLVSGLGGRPDVPVTFAVDGRLLDDAADLADGYTERTLEGPVEQSASSGLARAAAGFLAQLSRTLRQEHVETIAVPYGPADLSALMRGGMSNEAARLLNEGRVRVEGHTGVRPAPGVVLPAAGLSPAALTEVTSAGTRTLVMEARHLEGGVDTSTASPSPLRRLRSLDGTTVKVAVPDPWLSDLFADDDHLSALDPPVAVQRVIAETAAVYFERPFASNTRGLVMVPPLEWNPDSDFVAGLAGALKAAPWLQPVTLSTLVRDIAVPDTAPARIAYDDASQANELPLSYVRELRQSRRALGSLAGVLSTDSGTPERFDRMLLTAASVWFRGNTREGLALSREVVRTVDELYQSVAIIDGPTVLLSGNEGQLPVTIENRSPIPLRVAVRLQTQRFDFADGASRIVVVEPGARQTLGFMVKARTPGGTFPVQVVVEDQDGQLVLAQGTLVVRSTAVSVVALAVVVGATLFLLAWWLRTVAKRRRVQRVDSVSADARQDIG